MRRMLLLSLSIAVTACRSSVAAIDVPELSLDPHQTHVCIHLRELPASHGSTILFATGGDVSTNSLDALAVTLCSRHQLDLTDQQMAAAVEEFKQEYLADAMDHPLCREDVVDVTGLLIALYHQCELGRSRLVAKQETELAGRPLRIYYVEDNRPHEARSYLGRTTGNNIFVDVERIRGASGEDVDCFEARILSVLHHEQAHWLTTHDLMYGSEKPGLIRWARQTGVPRKQYSPVLKELGPSLASIARGSDPKKEMALLLNYPAGSHSKPRARQASKWDSPTAMGQISPALLTPFLKEQGFEKFYTEQLEDRFQVLNGCRPSVLDKTWMREQVDLALVIGEDFYSDYIAFFDTLDDSLIRSWAREAYELYFGELMEVSDDIPAEVFQWFHEKGLQVQQPQG